MIKNENTTTGFEDINDEFICPICRCERFKNRNLLCNHIMICDRRNPDNPIILNTIDYVKSEDLTNNSYTGPYVLIKRSILREKKVDNSSYEIKKESFYQTSKAIDMDASISDEHDVIPTAATLMSKDNLKMKITQFKSNQQQVVTDPTNKEANHTKTEFVKNICKSPLKTAMSLVSIPIVKEPDTNSDYLVCVLCSKVPVYQYRSKPNLLRHMKRYHPRGTKCRFCKSQYPTFDLLHEHVLDCKQIRINKPVVQSELSKPTGTRYFRCCMCFENRQFLEPAFIEHMIDAHCLNKANRFPKQRRQCIDCGSFLTNFKTLYDHCRSCADTRKIPLPRDV